MNKIINNTYIHIFNDNVLMKDRKKKTMNIFLNRLEYLRNNNIKICRMRTRGA